MNQYLLALLLLIVAGKVNATYQDSFSHTVVLSHVAQRIISLAPNLTEMLYEIGAQNQIVGRDKNSDHPTAVSHTPVVGDYFKISIEKIIKLHPDLVLVEQSPCLLAQIKKLHDLGIVVYVHRADSISSIPKTMKDLGNLTGHATTASVKVMLFRQKIASFKSIPHSGRTVFYELWDSPLLTVNNQTMIGQIISLCGGRNIAGDFKSDNPKISYETILKSNPDIILTSVNHSTWQRFKHLKAVKLSRVFYISPETIQRATPRILVDIENICHIIQNG